MSGKADSKTQQPRQGSVFADDNGLMEWLHAFWNRKEAPEKIQVWLVTGPQKDIRGPMIHHVDFKSNDDKNPEDCTHLANAILEACQHDCNTMQKKAVYEVAVTDRHRSSAPVVRRIGPLFPNTRYLTKPAPATGDLDGDDDEVMLHAKPMTLQYLDRLIAMVERKDQALNAIAGDLLQHASREIAELRGWNFRLMQGNQQMFLTTQDALDRKEDREDRRKDRMVARAREELIADGMREGARIAMNLLPRFIGTFTDKAPGRPEPEHVVLQPAASGAPTAPPDYGPSDERFLVENFLRDIAKATQKEGQSQRLDETLFGDWIPEGQNGLRPNPEKPGIFTADQVRIIVGVAQGALHPNCLDELVPEWGHANAITADQLMKAQAIVPESASLAVFELLGLRTKKRANAKTTATA